VNYTSGYVDIYDQLPVGCTTDGLKSVVVIVVAVAYFAGEHAQRTETEG